MDAPLRRARAAAGCLFGLGLVIALRRGARPEASRSARQLADEGACGAFADPVDPLLELSCGGGSLHASVFSHDGAPRTRAACASACRAAHTHGCCEWSSRHSRCAWSSGAARASPLRGARRESTAFDVCATPALPPLGEAAARVTDSSADASAAAGALAALRFVQRTQVCLSASLPNECRHRALSCTMSADRTTV
ncbi:hypothetical protein KFE25_010294 [Diacronema lutheri]|uniref:Uncharacterized protein n=2 Tax=Diacronema lutheri TaxID=2081491 RepID=A0A8J5XKX6_DIALT|nr:hypothetical protein KFE25_010294 [Diacronema lutheri]